MALTTADFTRLRGVFNSECERLLNIKGQEYAQGDIEDNRLNNFERLAVEMGVTPLQALGVYMFKHVDAVARYIRTNGSGATSEPIMGRLADMRNYIDLMYGMVVSSEEVLIVASVISECTCFTWSQADQHVKGTKHDTRCVMYSEEVAGG